MKAVSLILTEIWLLSASAYAGNVACAGARCTDSDYDDKPAAKEESSPNEKADRPCAPAEAGEENESQEQPR